MPPILSKRGVTPTMRFTCCDCGQVTTGLEVIRGEHVHIVVKNEKDPLRSVWRCECCQDEVEDMERE
jgi:ribosomal protein L34E